MSCIRTAFLALVAAFLLPLTTEALASEDLKSPVGQVLLTVSGEIAVVNDGATARFDLDMLKAMPAIEYRTTTIWTDGEKTFTGVPLSALLDRLGVSVGQIQAQAINDYAVEIPVAAIEADAPMIAYHMDGAPMSRRDKGPLWIVFPYDSDPSYRSEVNFSRSIWQLDRLIVTD